MDTRSPRTVVSADAVDELKACNAATDMCERHGDPRSWGGFVTFSHLTNSGPFHLCVQFLRGTFPAAALALQACIVCPGTMQHPILLGRHSYMRFEQRSYTTLPHQPLGPRSF